MNNTSNTVIQAIETIVDKKVSDLKFDRTVEVEILQIKDTTTGEYLARYNDNIISIFSNDKNHLYKIGEKVLIKIPEGDLSKKKTIENSSAGGSISGGEHLDDSEIIELQNDYIGVEPTIPVIYGKILESEYGLIAGPNSKSSSIEPNLELKEISFDQSKNPLFQQYIQSYDYLKISADFKTEFQSNFAEGNYGIKLYLTSKGDKEENKKEVYTLDINSFNGNYYHFYDYVHQEVIYPLINKEKIQGVSKVEIFENFKTNDKISPKEFNNTKNNIFIKDINIQFVEKVDLTNNLYYLQVLAPQGNIFNNQGNPDEKLTLEARLLYQNQSISTKDNSIYKWFKRDPSVAIGSESYNKNAGPGWKEINSTSKNERVDFNKIVVKKQEVLENRYKVIVIYNKKIALSKEAFVLNNSINYNFNISEKKEGKKLFLVLEGFNNGIKVECLGQWNALLPDGRMLSFDKTNSLDITELSSFERIEFTCDIFVGNVLYLTKEYIYHQEPESEGGISSFQVYYEGPYIFKYDANGDADISDYEISKTLKCIPLNLPKEMKYSIKWFIGATEIKGQSEIKNPDNSMLEKLWVDTEQLLHFNIKRRYSFRDKNNILTTVVTTLLDNKEYSFKKEIIFLKDGDLGTNGTSYYIDVFPSNNEGTALNKYTPLILGVKNSGYFSAKVYKDGESINENVSYFWECGEDLQVTNANFKTVTAQIKNNPSNFNYQYYLKLKVSISEDQKTIVLYKYFPIDIAVNFSNNEISENQLKLPSEIQYSSTGKYPKYNSNSFVYDSSIFSNFDTLDNKLIKVEKKEGEYYLKPISEFFYSSKKMGAIKCFTLSPDKYIIHPIVMYLNTYGNEAINGWDGTKLEFIGPKGEEHTILAPQIGAGKKDPNTNLFSGIVMGQNQDNEQKNQIGLYGYKDGVNTFSLNENGELRIKGYLDAESGPVHESITNITVEQGKIKTEVSKVDEKIGTVEQPGTVLQSVQKSIITQTDGKIKTEVSKVENTANEASKIATSAEQTANSFENRISGVEGEYNTITQTLDGVVYQDSGTGKTVINGSNITTGSINANDVTINNLDADNITSGSISANRISGGSIDANKVYIGGTYGGLSAKKGANAEGYETEGIRMYYDNRDYVIATEGGVRMQCGGLKTGNSIVVTPQSATLNYQNLYQIRVDSQGCRYNDGTGWKNIESGNSSNVIPVWG